ncbi:MAG: nitroreductase [Alphaproteobacteria bacterium]|nr:nitroreductase [Alphaproteobacteria bacterium]
MVDTPSSFNRPAPGALELLLSRRSGSAKAMTGPGPDAEQLRQILSAAARVPDHGKLAPWRFIVIKDEGRARLGEVVAMRVQQTEPDASSERLATERGRFLRAPVIVAVVSRIKPGIAIPEWEQQLSAGACCMTMLIAAHALGFVGNWLTEWYSFDSAIAKHLGLDENERFAGFIYFGQPAVPLEERARPNLDDLITTFE